MEPQRIATAALLSFFTITERWGLTEEQQRTVPGTPTKPIFSEWRNTTIAMELDAETLTRISYIPGVHKALHTIYCNSVVADGWLQRANDNPLFEGRPPMMRLVSGDESDLQLIRQHLEGHQQMPFT